jgi:hypothetical protein
MDVGSGRAVHPVLVALVAVLLASAPSALADVQDAGLALGSAAASGVGDAASDALGDGAERAAVTLGDIAVTMRPDRAGSTGARPGSGPIWRWNGWVSGAAGPETLDGSFSTFRGEPIGLVGAWADREEASQTEMSTVETFAHFDGEMDIAVGGLVRGETWEQAAAGRFVPRWTTAVRRLKALRGGKGTTYIRIAHEMNGDWMPWGVTSVNLAAYKKGYRLYASIVRREFPEARLTWSPNGGNHTDVSIDDLWPGDDVVDVIGPDIYDFDQDATTASSWAGESTAWQSPHTPSGLEAWRKYAFRRDRPMALPEWGLAAGDDPEWIRRVHSAMAEHSAPQGRRRAAGKFVYDCYFNAELKFKLLGGPNADAAAAYAALRWGS